MPLFVGLLFFNWGNAWWLGQDGANDPRERWVQTATDDDVDLLIETISEISRQTGGAETSLSLFSSVDTAVLRWYLRSFTQAEYGEAVPTAAMYDLIITPMHGSDPVFGADYTGADFGIFRPEIDHVLTPQDALRWWLFRQSPQPILEERVVLWLRTDLIANEN